VVRSGFTLIELIFAIVVIGISIISLPMMNQVTTKGIEGNLVQEIIFVASTELNQAVTATWAVRSVEDGGFNSLARVIDDGSGNCEDNSSLPNYRQMDGHINQPLHRRCLDSTSNIDLDLQDGVNIFSLNDMNKTDEALRNADETASGYKSAFTTTISIDANGTFGSYVTDLNIKKITVIVKDSDGVDITRLSTYCFNIGEVGYHKRSY